MTTPISRTSQIFTDIGMPRSDIMFSADALTHASLFIINACVATIKP